MTDLPKRNDAELLDLVIQGVGTVSDYQARWIEAMAERDMAYEVLGKLAALMRDWHGEDGLDPDWGRDIGYLTEVSDLLEESGRDVGSRDEEEAPEENAATQQGCIE